MTDIRVLSGVWLQREATMVLWRLADSMPSGMLMPRVIILSALRLTAGCIILRLSWSPVQSLKEALGNVVKMGVPAF